MMRPEAELSVLLKVAPTGGGARAASCVLRASMAWPTVALRPCSSCVFTGGGPVVGRRNSPAAAPPSEGCTTVDGLGRCKSPPENSCPTVDGLRPCKLFKGTAAQRAMVCARRERRVKTRAHQGHSGAVGWAAETVYLSSGAYTSYYWECAGAPEKL